MGRDGTPTRNKILAQSRALVLQNGFSGTSIDLILERTGITKGAFFYHFKTKNVLAQALIEEFAKEDIDTLESALEQTEHLKTDPKERLLQFVQLFIDMMTGLTEPYPGCLYASYTYEPNQFDPKVMEPISSAILQWRTTLVRLLSEVRQEYDMQQEVDISSLADLFTVIFEGAYVVSKALNEPDLVAQQLRQLSNYYELLFVPKQ
ncbi:helix-turn-helix domain-containing protein [Flavobacteriaceae bacterium 3-367]|uniref:TetR/AcrR family transcriptional regulator n=1 Tax=Eudoraea algarum TaxID=3417568 RepID=UPI00328CBA59